jgi:thioester reductase-like protein
MRVVTMARQAGMNLSVTDMFRLSTTSVHQLTLQLKLVEEGEVSESATQKVDPTRFLADIARYDAQIAAVPLNLNQATGTKNPRKRPTVLLTGANGFIGTQILCQFLENDQGGRVIAIIRGESAEVAKRRLIDAAKKALWWTEFHDAMLEVWPGDLSVPHLGLELTKWDLVKNGEIDIFVHNAASVHFIKGYDVLKPVNVASTVEMLCAATSNPGTRFVYVSSARHEDPTEEDEESVAIQLATNSNGYMQTKFVSETLVRRAAHCNANGQNQSTIVSPGLVIGTLTEGYWNTDEWIWRLTSACIRVGMYNSDNAATWVPMSDVGMIARTIVGTAMSSGSSSQPIVLIKGGLTLGDLWKTLITMGCELQASSGSKCAAAIHQDIQSSREAHPLWTLSDILEDLEDTAQDTWAASWNEDKTCSVRLRVAIQKSIRYLAEIGFLLSPQGGQGNLG